MEENKGWPTKEEFMAKHAFENITELGEFLESGENVLRDLSEDTPKELVQHFVDWHEWTKELIELRKNGLQPTPKPVVKRKSHPDDTRYCGRWY